MKRMLALIVIIALTVPGFGWSQEQSQLKDSTLTQTSRDPFQRVRTQKAKPTSPSAAKRPPRPSVAVLQGPPAINYLSGAAQVTVTGSSQQLRLAMAQHGSTMIEVPENDQIYGVFEGEPNLATVDQEALKYTRKFFIVRPGTAFKVPSPSSGETPPKGTPTASVTIQTRSGLVVTVLFYPVSDLALNAHHVTLRYKREEVVMNRRAEGLATNLVRDEGEVAQTPAPQMPATIITTSSPRPTSTNETLPEMASPPVLERRTDLGLPGLPAPPARKRKSESDIAKATREAVRDATRLPSQFSKWSDPVHGLSLSLSSIRALDAETNIVVFAVHNTLSEIVRLLPGSPDLVVDTLDDKGNRMMTDTVTKLTVESSTSFETLPAKATIYFAVTYRAPILGAHQGLRISLAQRNASDEPSSINLKTATK